MTRKKESDQSERGCGFRSEVSLGARLPMSPGRWQPSLNLYAFDDKFLMCVDLAGIDASELGVKVDVLSLTIHGKRACPLNGQDLLPNRVIHMEIDEGPFSRTVTLPNAVCPESVSVESRSGILWITLPYL